MPTSSLSANLRNPFAFADDRREISRASEADGARVRGSSTYFDLVRDCSTYFDIKKLREPRATGVFSRLKTLDSLDIGLRPPNTVLTTLRTRKNPNETRKTQSFSKVTQKDLQKPELSF